MQVWQLLPVGSDTLLTAACAAELHMHCSLRSKALQKHKTLLLCTVTKAACVAVMCTASPNILLFWAVHQADRQQPLNEHQP